MMITSPRVICRCCTAAKASSSQSKQRAGPRNCKFFMPATLTIAPSGASEPFKPTTPPVGDRGLDTGRMTSCLGSHFTSRRFSARVLPVTVMQSPCKKPASRRTLSKTGTPPASNMSLATKRPPGFKSARYGVFLKISATANKSKSIPHSCAIAGRCSAAFVEPPVAATTTAAFSSDFRVTISRGRIRRASNSMTALPLSTP